MHTNLPNILAMPFILAACMLPAVCCAQNCTIDAEIDVIARSFGGPLDGPFLPGETVEFCLRVNSWSSAGTGCPWFQGLVPVFGKGWDPASFTASGMPVNATLNGQPFPAPAIFSSNIWTWRTDVTYHHDNPNIHVDDFDGNGTLDICHAAFDPACQGSGLTGGDEPPCWDDVPGTLLPPGWFAHGSGGDCTQDGHPRHDRGDGNQCNTASGPWHFCFELHIRPHPQCLDDSILTELSVGFLTFSDLDIGGRDQDMPGLCASDSGYFMTYPACCWDPYPPELEDPHFCAGDSLNVDLTEAFDSIFTIVDWEIEPAWFVDGPSSGSGPFVQTILVNPTNEPVLITMHVTTLDSTTCSSPVYRAWDLELVIYPGADADNDGLCDALDNDADNDGIEDSLDNCPDHPNPEQADGDVNGLGDVCDDPPGERIGLNTDTPAKALHLHDGTLYIDNPLKGIVMKGMDGNCYRLRVNAAGELEVEVVGCP